MTAHVRPNDPNYLYYPFYTSFDEATGNYAGIPGQYPSDKQMFMDSDIVSIPDSTGNLVSGCVTNDRDQANALGGNYVASEFRDKDIYLKANPVPRPQWAGDMSNGVLPAWQGQLEVKLTISCYKKGY